MRSPGGYQVPSPVSASSSPAQSFASPTGSFTGSYSSSASFSSGYSSNKVCFFSYLHGATLKFKVYLNIRNNNIENNYCLFIYKDFYVGYRLAFIESVDVLILVIFDFLLGRMGRANPTESWWKSAK